MLAFPAAGDGSDGGDDDADDDDEDDADGYIRPNLSITKDD